MIELENIKNGIEIDEENLNNFISYIFQFSQINREYKSKAIISKKNEILDLLIPLLEKSLELNHNMGNEIKLQIMELLDTMNLRKEVLEIFENNISKSDLQKASIRIGKKSQSAFSQK